MIYFLTFSTLFTSSEDSKMMSDNNENLIQQYINEDHTITFAPHQQQRQHHFEPKIRKRNAWNQKKNDILIEVVDF